MHVDFQKQEGYLVKVDGASFVEARASVRHGDPWCDCPQTRKVEPKEPRRANKKINCNRARARVLLKRETGTGAMIDAVSIDAVNGCVRSSPAVDRMTIG